VVVNVFLTSGFCNSGSQPFC